MCVSHTAVRVLCRSVIMVTGQLADKPTRGQSLVLQFFSEYPAMGVHRVTGYSENGRKQAKTTENQRKRLNVTTFPTVLLHMLM